LPGYDWFFLIAQVALSERSSSWNNKY